MKTVTLIDEFRPKSHHKQGVLFFGYIDELNLYRKDEHLSRG
jgi:hypothetical protein